MTKLTGANLGSKKDAIVSIARYLKRNDSRRGGMAIRRIVRIVTQEVKVRGFNTSPVYFMDELPGITWYQGSLLKWNNKGGFNVTIG